MCLTFEIDPELVGLLAIDTLFYLWVTMYLLQESVGSQVYYYSKINFKAKALIIYLSYPLFYVILVILVRAETSVISPN